MVAFIQFGSVCLASRNPLEEKKIDFDRPFSEAIGSYCSSSVINFDSTANWRSCADGSCWHFVTSERSGPKVDCFTSVDHWTHVVRIVHLSVSVSYSSSSAT